MLYTSIYIYTPIVDGMCGDVSCGKACWTNLKEWKSCRVRHGVLCHQKFSARLMIDDALPLQEQVLVNSNIKGVLPASLAVCYSLSLEFYSWCSWCIFLAIKSTLSDASVAVRKGFVQKAGDKLTSECWPISCANICCPRSRTGVPWARFVAPCPEASASTNQISSNISIQTCVHWRCPGMLV